jgi:hypothetical protein
MRLEEDVVQVGGRMIWIASFSIETAAGHVRTLVKGIL